MSVRTVAFWVLAVALAAAGTAEGQKIQLGLVLEQPEPNNRNTRQLDVQAINAASDAFLRTRRFHVVERAELAKIFEEKSLKDILGDSDGNSLFETWGMDMIGFVSYKEDRSVGPPIWVLTVRLADVSTGEVIDTVDSVRLSAIQPSSLPLAGDHLGANLRERFPPEGMIVRVLDDKKVVVDMGSGMGIREGDTLQLIQVGEPIIHPDGHLLPGEEIEVGKLDVRKVSLQTSVCKVRSADVPIEIRQVVRYQGRFANAKRWVPKSVQRLLQQRSNEEGNR